MKEERINIQKSKDLLKALVSERMPVAGAYETGLEGVRTYRRDEPTVLGACLYEPMIVLMVQGNKRAIMGGEEFFWDINHIFVTGVDMPAHSMVCEASKDTPCMSIAMKLDKALLAQLSLEMPSLPRDTGSSYKGIHVQELTSDLADAFVRLAELFSTPEKLSILGPMVMREIHYLLLSGEDGHRLRSFHTQGSQNNQVTQAITWFKQNIALSIPIEELAEKVHMAPSTFHRHFKDVTLLSPLQYQKRLRLHEAQRLMLTEDMDASSAGLAVGYDSLSQFNREYKRLFGAPPKKDITKLKEKAFMYTPNKPRKSLAMNTY